MKSSGSPFGGKIDEKITVDTVFSDGKDGEFIKRLDANSEYGNEKLSQVQKEANQKRFFSDKGGETFGDAWGSGRAIAGLGASALGSMAPMLVTGGPLAAGAKGLVTKLGASATGKIASGAGALGYGLSEGGMVAGGVSGDIQKHVNTMPLEVIATAPGYQKLIADGLNDEQARAELGRTLGIEVLR